MTVNWQKYFHLGKNILVFFLGIVCIHILTQIIMSTSFPDLIKKISEEEIQDFITNLDKEIFSILTKIYIICCILFSRLPEKIRKSKWYLRGLYFIIFYILCVLVYLWI